MTSEYRSFSCINSFRPFLPLLPFVRLASAFVLMSINDLPVCEWPLFDSPYAIIRLPWAERCEARAPVALIELNLREALDAESEGGGWYLVGWVCRKFFNLFLSSCSRLRRTLETHFWYLLFGKFLIECLITCIFFMEFECFASFFWNSLLPAKMLVIKCKWLRSHLG